MCGGLNTNVLRASITQMQYIGKKKDKKIQVSAIGNKASWVHGTRMGANLKSNIDRVSVIQPELRQS